MTLQKTFIQSERKTPGWDVGLWFSWQKQAILRGTCWVICSYFSCSKSYNPNVCSKNCHWNQLFQHFQINWQVLVHWIMLVWEIQNVSIYNVAFFCSVILYIPINHKCMSWEIWTEHWRKWTIRYDMIWKIEGASSNFLWWFTANSFPTQSSSKLFPACDCDPESSLIYFYFSSYVSVW